MMNQDEMLLEIDKKKQNAPRQRTNTMMKMRKGDDDQEDHSYGIDKEKSQGGKGGGAGGAGGAAGEKERWDGETTNQFERLSNDVSGFGKMPGESETDSLDDRSDMDYYNNFKKDGLESMETNGFDFYNKIGSMM